MNKHSPTPYSVQPMQKNFNGYPDWTTANIRDNRNCHVATIGAVDRLTGRETQETAAFIVTACNSHADLITALTALVNAATAANTIIQNQRPDGQIAYDLPKAITFTRATIAKAEGTKVWTAEDILRREG